MSELKEIKNKKKYLKKKDESYFQDMNQIYERNCLKCNKKMKVRSKFKRLCFSCGNAPVGPFTPI